MNKDRAVVFYSKMVILMRRVKFLLMICFAMYGSYAGATQTKISSLENKDVEKTLGNNQDSKPEINEIVLGVVGSAHKSTKCIMDRVVAAIADEMNVAIRLKSLPAKRISIMLERGEIHGDFTRLDGYLLTVPSALKVSTPVSKIHYYAYGLQSSNLNITSWESLKNYKIAIPRGYTTHRKYLAGNDIQLLHSDRAAFEFVSVGRADLLIIDEITAKSIIKSESPQLDNVIKVGPSLGSMDFHTYFSPKYPELVDNYNNALKKLVVTKRYQDLFSIESCN